jgi:hypothetical protein
LTIVMGKRRQDADHRRFFDEFLCVKISRLRAMGYKPRAEALAAIPELKKVWRARSTERLQQAFDDAQSAILQALQSNDMRQRLIAARLMLRTRAARQRGLA